MSNELTLTKGSRVLKVWVEKGRITIKVIDNMKDEEYIFYMDCDEIKRIYDECGGD